MASPERQQVGLSARFKADIRGRAVAAGIRLAAPIITLGSENIVRNIPIEYELGFEEKIKELATQGKKFLIVPNHQSLGDTLAYFRTLDYIRRLTGIPGYFLLYTKTLATGDKGADTKGLQDVFAQELPKHEVSRVFLSRNSDSANFDTGVNLIEAGNEIKRHLKEGLCGIIHPEGNLNSSRLKGTDEPPNRSFAETIKGFLGPESSRLQIERNGMQRFQRNALRSIIDQADKLGIDLAVVPITVDRTYNFYDPSTGTITRSALRTGLNLAQHDLAKVFVSNPMDINQGVLGEIRDRHRRMSHQDWEDFNTVIATIIASHLPEKMRGAYAANS